MSAWCGCVLFAFFTSLIVASAHNHDLYDKFANELSLKLEEGEREGERREREEGRNEEYFTSEIRQDLAPFSQGISRKMLEGAAAVGNKYQIINHTLYRARKCVFSLRCEAIDKLLKEIIQEVEDTELYVNEFDHPKTSTRNPPLPLFSFSKLDGDHWDILYPAWAFHSAGPAISVYPRGIGEWGSTMQLLLNISSSLPWEDRTSKAFFLGSRTNEQRDALVLLSRKRPDLVDAKFTKNQAYKGPQDTLGEEAAAEQPFEYNCRFKFLFNFRGVAASFRFKHLLLCGSTVMHVEDGWREFFYRKLVPYYHYIPVEENTQEYLEHLIEYAREHEEEMRKIGERGQVWVREHLRMEDVHAYWRELLKTYTALLPEGEVTLDPSLLAV